MKKLNILLSATLVLGLAACDDKSDLGIMQTNPQLGLMTADGVTVAYGDDIAGDALSLAAHKDGNINVIKLVEAKNLPEDATISYVMEIASKEDFSDARKLDVKNDQVAANDWENIYLDLIGKSPLPQTNWIRFAAYVKDGNSIARLGGRDFYYAAKAISVTPYDLQLPVEASYNLVIGGQTFVMDHSSKHQYDDPVFSYIFDVTAEQASNGLEWYITTQGGMEYGISSDNVPNDESGKLMEGGAHGVITRAGSVKVEVNMLDLTYSITPAFLYIYTPGPANGWSFENNMLLTTSDYINYDGFVYIDQEFKLTGQAGWEPLNWGDNGKGGLSLGGANIKVDPSGLYYVTANLNELTYTLTHISSIGLIGGFNEWKEDVMMTPSADFKTWTGELTTTAENQEWKFRMNGDWTVNLGASKENPANLIIGGDNLKIAEPGTYTVTLNLGTLPYTCTVEKK